MYRILLASLLFLGACKGKSGQLNNSSSQNAASFNEEEMDFVDGCVENAKVSMGEQKAFTLCKCVLMQMKQENPSLDSSAMVKVMNDTAKIAKFAKNCQ